MAHGRRLGLGVGASGALGLQHLLEEGLRVLRRVSAVDVFDLFHHGFAVGRHAVGVDVAAAQGVLQPEEAALHAPGHVDHVLKVAGSLLQAVQRRFDFRQLVLEDHGGVRHFIEHRLGVRHRLAEPQNPLLHGIQQVRQIAQVPPEGPGALVQPALAAGEGASGRLQLVQALGGGVEAVLNVAEGIQQLVQTAGQGPVVLLQVVLPLAELGDLLQLGQGGGHHHHGQAAEGKGIAAHADGEMLLLPGEAEKQHRPQVAHQLDLGARGLQGEDVVLVEQGRGGQGVIVAGVVAGGLVWRHVQQNLHHPPLSRQVLRLGGDAVEGVAEGQRPGELLEGLAGLALEVEVVRRAAVEAEGGPVLPPDRRGAVGEVDHLVVDAVVRQAVRAVEGVAFHHAGLQQVAVVVQGGVVRLVIRGGHAAADGFHSPGGQSQRDGQDRRQGQGGGAGSQGFPVHHNSSI